MRGPVSHDLSGQAGANARKSGKLGVRRRIDRDRDQWAGSPRKGVVRRAHKLALAIAQHDPAPDGPRHAAEDDVGEDGAAEGLPHPSHAATQSLDGPEGSMRGPLGGDASGEPRPDARQAGQFLHRSHVQINAFTIAQGPGKA